MVCDNCANVLVRRHPFAMPIVSDLPTGPTAHLKPVEALGRLPGAQGERFVALFAHGSLVVELYAPRGSDPQTPHTRDELYVVIAGSGQFDNGSDRQPFAPGDCLFVAAGTRHRFVDFTDDLTVWVVFYGPEGGEGKA
jgi:mannose-6-phosphate isomerase-like protein (cupin superfamily)